MMGNGDVTLYAFPGVAYSAPLRVSQPGEQHRGGGNNMRGNRVRTVLAAAALAVGLAGCAHTPVTVDAATPAVSPASSAEHNGPMVDVESIWATTPLPPCPRVIVDNNIPDAPGAELPTRDTVAAALQGVKSPASEKWVHDELGWVTQWLVLTRGAINTAGNPVLIGSAMTPQFDRYVKHVKSELEAGHDIPDHIIDTSFPEDCK